MASFANCDFWVIPILIFPFLEIHFLLRLCLTSNFLKGTVIHCMRLGIEEGQYPDQVPITLCGSPTIRNTR